MTNRRRVWAVIAVTYLSARLVVRLLTAGAIALDAPLIVELVVVPLVQIAVLELVTAWIWRGALKDEDSCAS